MFKKILFKKKNLYLVKFLKQNKVSKIINKKHAAMRLKTYLENKIKKICLFLLIRK